MYKSGEAAAAPPSPKYIFRLVVSILLGLKIITTFGPPRLPAAAYGAWPFLPFWGKASQRTTHARTGEGSGDSLTPSLNACRCPSASDPAAGDQQQRPDAKPHTPPLGPVSPVQASGGQQVVQQQRTGCRAAGDQQQ